MGALTRPNVLLIYTDQQRTDSMGCYGSAIARTPNLDRLACEGVRLDRFFVQCPVCMPSRMSFLTGRYSGSLGIGTNGIPLPAETPTLPRMLAPYGYHTAQIGKLHFQPHARRWHCDPHPDYGFRTLILSDEPGCYDDAYIKWVERVDPAQVPLVRTQLPPAAHRYDKPNYSRQGRAVDEAYVFEGREELTHTAFVASETCRFLQSRAPGGEPFFAIAGIYAPHTPINPPARFAEMFDPGDMPDPILGEAEGYQGELAKVAPEQWRKIRAYYMALVAHVDDQVGRILRTLEERGLAEETLVIFTSDHGEYLGDHGRVQKGMPGHECIVRVPFLLRYPCVVPAGGAATALVEAVDMVPTVLHYCGIQQPRGVQGRSLADLLEGRTREHRDDVLTEHFTPFGPRSATVRTDRYKYHWSSTGLELLYDLEQDPRELVDLSTAPATGPVLSDMRRRLIGRLAGAAYQVTERPAEY